MPSFSAYEHVEKYKIDEEIEIKNIGKKTMKRIGAGYLNNPI